VLSELLIVPFPLPDDRTVKVKGALNVAVTSTAELPIVRLQVPVPEHAPVHPAKTAPPVGVAVNTTLDPALKFAEQVAPQLIPAGALVTDPVPTTLTFTGNAVGTKDTPTVCAVFIVTEQAPVPEQAPLQPANTDPACAVGVRTTVDPELNAAEHVVEQLIPAGALSTVPSPPPEVFTVNVNWGGPDAAKFAVTV
jgi:hypothetical protein